MMGHRARTIAVTALLWLACGARSGLPPSTGSTSDGGDEQLLACSDTCSDLVSACGSDLAFDQGMCESDCLAKRPFDDCVADCGGRCTCYNDCYRGDPLTCGGFCKWTQVYTCPDLDFQACRSACRRDGSFSLCVFACDKSDCTCIENCF